MNNQEFIEFQNKEYKTTNHELIGMLYKRTEEIRAILSILNRREEERMHTIAEFKMKQQDLRKYDIKSSRELVNQIKKTKNKTMEVNRMAKKGKPKEEQKPKA